MAQLTKFDLKKVLIKDGISPLIVELNNLIPPNLYHDLIKVQKEGTKVTSDFEVGGVLRQNFEFQINTLYRKIFMIIDDIPIDDIPSFNSTNDLKFPSEESLMELLMERNLGEIFKIYERISLIDTSYPYVSNDLLILRKTFIDLVEKRRKNIITDKEAKYIEDTLVTDLLDLLPNLNVEEIKNNYESNNLDFMIHQAKLTHSKTMDIGNLGLNKIPDEIFELINLEVLIYSSKWYDYETKEEKESQNKKISNQINRIPKEISKLKNLKALYLGGDKYPNYISDLSPLNELENLEILDIRNNKIEKITFPPNLESLKHLNLSENNKLRSFSRIEQLTNLQSLNLGGVRITEISLFRNLSQLQSLNLSKTTFSDLKELRNLTQLQILDLSYSMVTSLVGIQKLTKLESLNLSNSGVTGLKEITNLTNLKSLNLGNLKIYNLNNFRNLLNLEFLNLNNVGITSLQGIENFSKLKSLVLSHLEITDFKIIKNLTQLKFLDISNSTIMDFDGIENFVQLQSLILYYTVVENLSGLENLPKLKSRKFKLISEDI
jgi:internalin A